MIKLMRERSTFVFFPSQMESSFITPYWQEAIKVAKEKDFNLNICNGRICDIRDLSHLDHVQENVTYDLVKPAHIDGIVLLSSVILSSLTKDDQKGFIQKFASVPVVSIGIRVEGAYSLLIDNKRGITELVRHLVEKHNCKKIAFLKGRESSDEAQERFEAYLATLAEYGIAIDQKLIVPGNFTYEDGLLAVKTLLDERRVSFDALLCANDYMALGASEGFKCRGLSVPEDVLVTGFDNVTQAQYHIPALTTVNQPLNLTSRMAFEWLNDLVVNQGDREEILRFVPTQMIIRESCGCLPILIESTQGKSSESGSMSLNNGRASITELADILDIKEEEIENSRAELQTLTDQFYISLKTKDSYLFLKTLYKYLIKEILHCDNESIYKAVFNMKLLFLRDLTLEEEKIWCESLFSKAQLLLNSITQLRWGYNQAQLMDLYVKLRILLRNISTATDWSGLLNIIAKNIPFYNIDQCYITFYKSGTAKRISSLKWEIPEQSQLVMSVNKGQVSVPFDKGPIFKTDELLPDNQFYRKDEQVIWITRPLFNRSTHFGNIVFSGSLIDAELYATLHGIICTGLMSVYLLEEREKQTTLLEEHKQQLESANEKLTELDRMKTDFIQNITHEFRSPLSIIMNSADLALKYDELLNNLLKERLNIIYNASLKLNSNIDKLLDLAKMDSSKLELRITPINLEVFLSDVVDFYKSVAIMSHVTIESELSGVKEINDFYTDSEKLEDIINNIFSNALKFTEPEKGKIIVKTTCNEKSIIIAIKDNGAGIEKEQLSKIFERFMQSDSGLNSRFKGTGIGLSFAQQLTQLLKGKIWADSEGKNKGTTFYLEFPRGKNIFPPDAMSDDFVARFGADKRKKMKRLIKSEIIDVKAENDQIRIILPHLNKEAEFEHKKALVLIVEDNSTIMNIEKEYLEKEGYTNFILARNGIQGIEAIYRYQPDIVICDYNMPGMSGDQLHDKIYNDPFFKMLPFVFITAINNKELIRERKEKGAIAYLLKPLDESELISTVNTHLKRYMHLKESLYLSRMDQLTGLINKKTLHTELLKRIMLRNYRHLSLIFFDIDHFKDVNDTYGHQIGDEVLKTLGHIVSHLKRDYDSAGRYGGEEFLLILPETNQRQALELAKKLRDTINAMEIKTEQGILTITNSYGISSLVDNSRIIENALKIESLEQIYNITDAKAVDWEEINKIKNLVGETLLKLADDALYEAKNDYCGACGFSMKEQKRTCPICDSSDIKKGRNRIVFSK